MTMFIDEIGREIFMVLHEATPFNKIMSGIIQDKIFIDCRATFYIFLIGASWYSSDKH